MTACKQWTMVVTVCFLLVGVSAHPDIRTWTSVSGATIEAEFVEQRVDQVELRNADGERITIRLNQLSREDQIYVGEQRAMPARGASQEAEISEALEAAFGTRLMNARRQRVSTAELEGKTIGLYFSAQWCPPCRTFTPVLKEAYEELQKQGKPFQIVFVSHDRSENDMVRYMRDYSMPWLAVPFNIPLREELKKRHGISGIPALIIVDDEGSVLSTNGRAEVAADGAAAFDRWKK